MEERKRITRRRFSVEEKRELVRAWKRSGMSAEAFARQEGMAPSNLWRWSSSLGTAAKQDPSQPPLPKASAFAAIEVVQPKATTSQAGTPVCELVHPGGAVMRIYSEADERVVRMVASIWLGGAAC